MPFESNTETGRISVMKGSRRVLVKVVLFQLRGRGHPQDDAMANFLQILNALYFWCPKMLSVPRALCVKSWLKTSLKIGKIPIFTPLEGSKAVKSRKQKRQAPQNT